MAPTVETIVIPPLWGNNPLGQSILPSLEPFVALQINLRWWKREIVFNKCFNTSKFSSARILTLLSHSRALGSCHCCLSLGKTNFMSFIYLKGHKQWYQEDQLCRLSFNFHMGCHFCCMFNEQMWKMAPLTDSQISPTWNTKYVFPRMSVNLGGKYWINYKNSKLNIIS